MNADFAKEIFSEATFCEQETHGSLRLQTIVRPCGRALREAAEVGSPARRAASPAPWARRGLARVRIDVGEPWECAISLATCVGGRRSADGSAVVQKVFAAVQRSHGWSCAAYWLTLDAAVTGRVGETRWLLVGT